ncbi:trypco2 family protein [Streptomyces sp. NPDC085944]|uniref:trypco2 family protein n=1 Tax=Streptomyces sp. NPDC085944 TaxID=3154962 RepID=UPI00342ACF12
MVTKSQQVEADSHRLAQSHDIEQVRVGNENPDADRGAVVRRAGKSGVCWLWLPGRPGPGTVRIEGEIHVPQEPWAELGETIGVIRTELQKAMEEGRAEPLKFRTGPVELEFTVEVKKDLGARTRIFVLPWTVEAQGAASAARTHRVKLTLQPVDGDGDDLKISADSPQRPE